MRWIMSLGFTSPTRRPPIGPRRGLEGRAAEDRRRGRGQAMVMSDGGMAAGHDIVTAMASGADLVGLGRMQC